MANVKGKEELQRSKEALSLYGAAALFKEPKQRPQSIFEAPEYTESLFPISWSLQSTKAPAQAAALEQVYRQHLSQRICSCPDVQM